MTQIQNVCPVKQFKKNYSPEFKNDILFGLSQPIKSISSKYFYDDHGSRLFNHITKHPDYYLTNCEIEILQNAKKKLVDLVERESINLVELGPGEGIKTEILVEYFLQKKKHFTYIPIDISSQYLQILVKKLDAHKPPIPMLPIHADYFSGLKWLNKDSNTKNLVLFLGSSVGNFTPDEALSFFKHLRENIHPGDYVLTGFDLRKKIDTLMRAYDDSYGITRDFNMNVLNRINRELNGHFDIEKFQHFPVYNVRLGTMESFLVSLEPQCIAIDALNTTFTFETAEPIHLEYSHKYLISQIEQLALNTGFKVVEHYYDSKAYFSDSLWQAV